MSKKLEPPKAEPAGPDSTATPKVKPAIIIALIATLALALLLKAWDDRQRRSSTAKDHLQTEVSLLHAQIESHAAAAQTALALSASSSRLSARAVEATPSVDQILSLDQLKASRADARLVAAANTADALIEASQHFGLTETGDWVVLAQSGTDDRLVSLAAFASWLTEPQNGQVIHIEGDRPHQLGDTSLGTYSLPIVSNAVSSTLAGRSILLQACTQSAASPTIVCLRDLKPLLSLDDAISLLIYLLLFGVPALAWLMLIRQTEAPQPKNEIDTDLFDAPDPTDRLDVFAHGANVGYWELTDHFTQFQLNPMAQELLGLRYKPSAVLSEIESHIARSDQERFRNTISEAASSGWIFARFKTAGRTEEKWIEFRGGLGTDEDIDPQTGLVRFVGIILDVTEQARHEMRIRKAERRLRSAIEHFTEPFALWDRRRRLVFWNEAYASTFGLETVLKPGISEDTVSVARAGAIRKETLSSEDANTTVFALQNKRHIKMVDRPTENGGMISFGLDISEGVLSEQQLGEQKKKLKILVTELERSEGRAAEMARKYGEEKARAEHASRTKSAFLANMSHELRTPLNAVNGFSEIIAHELYGPVGDKRYKEYAADILASGQHLLDMINEILDMAKIEAGKMSIDPRRIDPVEPVDAAIRMVRRRAEDKSIELVLEHDDSLPDIFADHRAVRQMMLNLVSNAIKFTGHDGKITVKVKKVEDDIEFGVRDTGVGISKEDLPRLGQPFEQVKDVKDINSEGTGLGLALTKSFAEMHGGRLTIDSKIGEGTLIRFYLPIEGPAGMVSKEASFLPSSLETKPSQEKVEEDPADPLPA